MVELLGLLIAAVLVGLACLVLRALRGLRRWAALLWGGRGGDRLKVMRGVRLRAARAVSRDQAARIAGLTSELDRTRRALKLAEAALPAGTPPEDRFRRAKRAFAVLFHPDRLRCQEPERGLRVRVFQQYWQVLRQIERG